MHRKNKQVHLFENLRFIFAGPKFLPLPLQLRTIFFYLKIYYFWFFTFFVCFEYTFRAMKNLVKLSFLLVNDELWKTIKNIGSTCN